MNLTYAIVIFAHWGGTWHLVLDQQFGDTSPDGHGWSEYVISLIAWGEKLARAQLAIPMVQASCCQLYLKNWDVGAGTSELHPAPGWNLLSEEIKTR